MLRFGLRRVGSLVAVVIALSVLVFVVQRMSGADPVRAYVGANASPASVARARRALGLDLPLWHQYVDYVVGLLRGDLGLSLTTKRAVAVEIAQRFPATAELALWTIAFSIVIALAVGALYAVPGRSGRIARFVFLSAASAPSFLVATAGLLLFFSVLDVLPAQGRSSYGPLGPTGFLVLDGLLHGNPLYSWDAVQHVLVPAVSAAIAPGVAIGRVLADGIGSGMRAPFARTARSLGETEPQILVRHAFRFAASPALSLLGVQTGLMLSSLVVVEQIFSWNGLGQYLTAAIGAADLASVAGVSLVLGVAYVVINAVVDVLLAVVDPRLRTL